MIVYHATKSGSARKILAEGFKPGANEGGVYVTWHADLYEVWGADTTIRLEVPDKLCADYQPPNNAPWAVIPAAELNEYLGTARILSPDELKAEITEQKRRTAEQQQLGGDS